ncbi:MAG: hypothetical protein JXD22_17290 [Sedimentisphaerales bacterium]|nr:hypothetical protein [Sedimentisphaerales bacterium]
MAKTTLLLLPDRIKGSFWPVMVLGSCFSCWTLYRCPRCHSVPGFPLQIVIRHSSLIRHSGFVIRH